MGVGCLWEVRMLEVHISIDSVSSITTKVQVVGGWPRMDHYLWSIQLYASLPPLEWETRCIIHRLLVITGWF